MKSKIHIQHVLLSLQPGGLENGVVNVVNRLDENKFRSSVCCLKQAGEFSSRITDKNVDIHELGWAGGNNPQLVLKLADLFRKTKTDIVHTRNAESFFYGFLGAKIAKISTIIHSEHGRTFDDRRLRFTIQRIFSHFTHRIFAVTEQLKRDLVKHVGLPARQIEVIYNGVDLTRFVPVARKGIRVQLGIQREDFLIGTVGRLVAVKNYQLLMRAVANLEMEQVKLFIVGDGQERRTLQDLAGALGITNQVQFLGHREDVSAILPAFDLFVMPSLSEGMSNTLLEAMGAGVAVIASDVGGNPEIVRHGIDGLLFPNNDLNGLTQQIRSMVAQPFRRIHYATLARERMQRDFSIDAMIARYEKLYESAFGQRAC